MPGRYLNEFGQLQGRITTREAVAVEAEWWLLVRASSSSLGRTLAVRHIVNTINRLSFQDPIRLPRRWASRIGFPEQGRKAFIYR